MVTVARAELSTVNHFSMLLTDGARNYNSPTSYMRNRGTERFRDVLRSHSGKSRLGPEPTSDSTTHADTSSTAGI